MQEIEIVPRGPFSLDAARDFADGFPAGIGGGGVGASSITLAFPLEGTAASVAAELWQDADGVVRGRTDAPAELVPALTHQASRALSLDHDGSGWPAVGKRDPVLGELQREYDHLRPVCFYSAYEAATSFVIGQRISRRQASVIKRELADALGDRPTVDGTAMAAFPRPARLLELREARGLNAEKVRRLHGLATAAIDGRLDTDTLRAAPEAEALEALQLLPGVGPFTANGVLYRGCGIADGLPGADELGKEVIRDLYAADTVTGADVERMAEAWRPYRMWAVVLLRMAWTRRSGAGVSYRR